MQHNVIVYQAFDVHAHGVSDAGSWRGFRTIDPGDIEAVLTRRPGVDQAVALGRPVESESAQGIVAFMAASREDPTSLYDARRQEVPADMISNKIHVILSVPLNSNGRVDRNARRARLGLAV